MKVGKQSVHWQGKHISHREEVKARLKEADIIREKNKELKQKNTQLEKLLHELKIAQSGLRRSESRFRSVAQSANDAIITADSTGNITFWNKRAETIFGYTEEEALGRSLTLLMPVRYKGPHQQGIENFISHNKDGNTGRVMEVYGLRKDSSEFPLELSVAGWETDEGKFVTGILRDITQRKQAEEALENARALLEEEHRRKTEELEKAREVQLSMLPQQLPQLPHIRMDACMSAANEVGGDYYDAHLAEDGTLTVVVGDATGHGLNAGMMVAATKSIFTILVDEPDLEKLFNQLNRGLKRLKLPKLYMSLQIIRIKDYHLEICSAGMPPLTIYRAGTQQIDQVTIKGMPLGSFSDLPHQKRELSISPGDTLMLMSDGFPELFNTQNEMLDYQRTRNAFREAADRSPKEIIDHMIQLGKTWIGGGEPDDDVTFVVIKVQ